MKLFSFKIMYRNLALLLAFGVLTAFAIQYPLQTTFPIGGDAAVYARLAKISLNFLHEPRAAFSAVTQVHYPLAQFIFSFSGLLPLSWPERFTWMMVAAQIMSGLSLALLLRRLSTWRAAAAGLAMWGLVTIGLNPHFEDATFAQLLSLTPLLLALERIVAGARWSALAICLATLLAHPLSGMMLFASLMLGFWPWLPFYRRLPEHQRRQVLFWSIALGAAALLILLKISSSWLWIDAQTEDFFLLDILKSKLAPWLILSIAGLPMLLRRVSLNPSLTILLSFMWLSFLLSTNYLLGIGIFANRFRTYFILSVIISAALAWPAVLGKTFRQPLARISFGALLFISLFAITWRNNTQVYSFYETPEHYNRLHPDVLAALGWMDEQLPVGSYLITTAANRHSEWIPVLTKHQWREINPADPLLQLEGQALSSKAQDEEATHIAFFPYREDVPQEYLNHPEWFPIVFQNNSAVIMSLP